MLIKEKFSAFVVKLLIRLLKATSKRFKNQTLLVACILKNFVITKLLISKKINKLENNLIYAKPEMYYNSAIHIN